MRPPKNQKTTTKMAEGAGEKSSARAGAKAPLLLVVAGTAVAEVGRTACFERGGCGVGALGNLRGPNQGLINVKYNPRRKQNNRASSSLVSSVKNQGVCIEEIPRYSPNQNKSVCLEIFSKVERLLFRAVSRENYFRVKL
jgi:hypothetical protein